MFPMSTPEGMSIAAAYTIRHAVRKQGACGYMHDWGFCLLLRGHDDNEHENVPKVHDGAECPCGITRSDCEYHK